MTWQDLRTQLSTMSGGRQTRDFLFTCEARQIVCPAEASLLQLRDSLIRFGCKLRDGSRVVIHFEKSSPVVLIFDAAENRLTFNDINAAINRLLAG